MKSLDFGRYALTSCVAAAMLALCGADRRTGEPSEVEFLTPPMRYSAMLLLLIFLACAPSTARSSVLPGGFHCKNGDTPSYSDISSVMFERNGCGMGRYPARNLGCSNYWVYFGKYGKRTYSQGSKSIGQGGFVLGATLQEARDTLARHAFFSLAAPDVAVSDVMESILTVRRCSVVTRLLMYPTTVGRPSNPEVDTLFADFDGIIARSTKQQISNQYLYFNLNVFDLGIYVPAGCAGEIPLGVVGCILPASPAPRSQSP